MKESLLDGPVFLDPVKAIGLTPADSYPALSSKGVRSIGHQISGTSDRLTPTRHRVYFSVATLLFNNLLIVIMFS